MWYACKVIKFYHVMYYQLIIRDEIRILTQWLWVWVITWSQTAKVWTSSLRMFFSHLTKNYWILSSIHIKKNIKEFWISLQNEIVLTLTKGHVKMRPTLYIHCRQFFLSSYVPRKYLNWGITQSKYVLDGHTQLNDQIVYVCLGQFIAWIRKTDNECHASPRARHGVRLNLKLHCNKRPIIIFFSSQF